MDKLKFIIPDGYIVDKEQTTDKELVYVKKDNRKITDRIKSVNDAIEYLGEDDEAVKDYRLVKNAGLKGHGLRYFEAIIFTKALNEKWIPDWDNSNERKWWLWWNMTTSGFGVSLTYFDFWSSTATVGSRLVFKSKELALYAAAQEPEMYKEFLTIKK